jgi:hypothetical protein
MRVKGSLAALGIMVALGAGLAFGSPSRPSGRRHTRPASASHRVRMSAPVGSTAKGWRTQVVVSPERYVWGSRLAVSEKGDAVLAWLQGRPQAVCAESPCGQPGIGYGQRARPWPGLRVMVDQGSAVGGFGRPVVVSSHGQGQMYVAQLSSGISYVAWTALHHRGWLIAAVNRGHVSRATALPPDAQLQALLTGRSRKAAAVWFTVGNPASSIHYAFLGPHARLGHQGNIALIRGEGTYPELAMNDHGALAAIWSQGRSTVLATCDARGTCARPTNLAVPPAVAVNSAVAVSDDGTVSALVGLHSYGRILGLWSAVAHAGRTGARVSKLASSGDFPVVAAQGTSGATAMFSPRGDLLSWSFLDPSSGRFSRPVRVPDTEADSPPLLAANLGQRFAGVWFHFTRRQNPNYQIRASIGSAAQPGRPVILVRGDQDVADRAASLGIDGQGHVVVTWEQFGPPPPATAGGGDHGLFAEIRSGH